MSVRYVSVREDKFTARTQGYNAGQKLAAELNTDLPHRRPLNGLEIYEDTYATLSVTRPNGRPVNLKHTAVGDESLEDSYTSSFIVQSISESREEKQQLVPTFGDDYAYYYGQRPRMITVNAILPHAENFQWNQEFWTNYENTLRGTRLVDKDARVYLYVDRQVYEGYMVSADTTRSADNQHIVQLRFTMHVTASTYTDVLRNKPVNAVVPDFNADSAINIALETDSLRTSIIALKETRTRTLDYWETANNALTKMMGASYRKSLALQAAQRSGYIYERPHDYVSPSIKLPENSTNRPAADNTVTTEIVLRDDLIFERGRLSVVPVQQRVRRAQTTEYELVEPYEPGIADKLLSKLGSSTVQNLIVGAAAAAAVAGIAVAAYDEYGDTISNIAGDGGFWDKLKRVSGYLWTTASNAAVSAAESFGAELKDEFEAAGYSFIGTTPSAAPSDISVDLPAKDAVVESRVSSGPQSQLSDTSTLTGAAASSTDLVL